MSTEPNIDELLGRSYQHGFVTDIESDTAAAGPGRRRGAADLAQEEASPQFLTDWRLKAYRHWLTMREPHWAKLRVTPIDYQAISYYSAPKPKANAPKSLDEVDPKLLETYEKLGVPLHERARLAGVAVDAVFDSVSVATTFKERLAEAGVIFCPFSEAVQIAPGTGRAVPRQRGAVHRQLLRHAQLRGVLRRLLRLRAARRALPDGAVHLLPHQRGQHRPVRAHADHRRRGQLRELPRRLHGADARREPAARGGRRAGRAGRRADQVLDGAELVSRATSKGVGGIYNFVTKRGECRGRNSRISWTQVETGSAITWKYPSCVLRGEDSVGRVLLGRHRQQLPAGRHRHEDDPHRRQHAQHDRLEGHLGRPRPEHLPRPGEDPARARTARATSRSATRC